MAKSSPHPYDEREKRAQQRLAPRANIHARPRVTQVVVSTGIGALSRDETARREVTEQLARITGQRPAERRARKSISGFNVRRGLPVGLKVTLRRERMKDFLEKFIQVTLPRMRDFRGIPYAAVDRQANLTIGFREQLPFPEIEAEGVERLFGLAVTLVTNLRKREEAIRFFQALGLPMTKERLRKAREERLVRGRVAAREEKKSS
jgi:large subunit ribosomal protein L5